VLHISYSLISPTGSNNFGTWHASRWGVNASTTFRGTAPLKFWRAKTCKNQCDLRQLSSLSANISGSDKDSDKI